MTAATKKRRIPKYLLTKQQHEEIVRKLEQLGKEYGFSEKIARKAASLAPRV